MKTKKLVNLTVHWKRAGRRAFTSLPGEFLLPLPWASVVPM